MRERSPDGVEGDLGSRARPSGRARGEFRMHRKSEKFGVAFAIVVLVAGFVLLVATSNVGADSESAASPAAAVSQSR